LLDVTCAAQTTTAPPVHLAHLQRGVNVGRFLDGTLQNDSYKCCTLQDIAQIKKIGFDHIRILIEPGSLFDLTKPDLIDGKSLEDLDTIVRSCVKQETGIILAIALDEDRFKDKLGKDDTFAVKFAEFWRSLAQHYSAPEFPIDLIFFEVKNEPGLNEADLTDAQWAGIQTKLVAAIRHGASQNTIIATGAQKSDLLGLLALQPLSVDHVVYVFHYYEPYSFTHQGETWNDNYAKFLKEQHVRYPYVPESARVAADQVPDLIQRLFALHDMEGAANNRIESDIHIVKEWAKLHGVTVICDEFGVIKPNTDPQDRAQWTKDVRTLLDQYGFGWTFWDYSSDSFGLVHTPNQFDASVVQALGMTIPSAAP
jgi:aryl-phospho-beta-D-glucosidase BglC (GH1 family)